MPTSSVASRSAASRTVSVPSTPPPGSDTWYARTANSTDETLYSMAKSRLEGIELLATDPLSHPDWEPPGTSGESDSQGSSEGESSN